MCEHVRSYSNLSLTPCGLGGGGDYPCDCWLFICNIKNNDNSRIGIRTPTNFVRIVGIFEMCDMKNGDSYEDCD